MKLKLGNGKEIEAIGFGTYKVTEELTNGSTKEIIRTALDAGYRYIDTAVFYQNEAEIGEAILESGIPREELYLATKVWKTDLGYEKTKASIEGSLQRLQTGYIDLLLIHWPKEFPGDPEWKEKIQGSWKAMEEAVEAGKVRDLGLSNFLPHHILALMETAKIRPVLDQLELHVGHMQWAAVEYCQKNNILVQAWSPLGRTRVFRHPALLEMAEKYNVTVSDLLLRFLLSLGISVIPKASTAEHMRSNLHPAEFELSEADRGFLLTMPPLGWAGEHPDFGREPVDNRFLL